MPRALAARPRKMLPPPMTIGGLDAEAPGFSRLSWAMRVATAGSMPYGWSPIRASPDSLRRMRL